MSLAVSERGIFFRTWGDEGVLMHLPTERYFGLDRIGTLLWRRLLEGASRAELLQVAAGAGADAATAEKAVTFVLGQAERLEALVEEPGGRYRVLSHVVGDRTETAEVDGEAVRRARLRPWLVFQLLFQTLQVRFRLKFFGLASTLERLQRRTIPSVAADEQETRLYECVRARILVRNLTTKGLPDCVYDAIAGALVMRRQGVPAEVCVGVRKVPFHAHAWIEARGKSVSERRREHEEYPVIARF
jgi:hypothetical protein